MSKRKRQVPLLEALKAGRSFTFTLADGGNLASMRGVLKHGQTLTFSPVVNFRHIQNGDIVLVKWRGGGHIMHLVGDIQDDRYLIINSLGGVNGWVDGSDIVGWVTEIVDPDVRPSVPDMLDQLDETYQMLCERGQCMPEDAQVLCSIVSDMRWYASRIDPTQWDVLPRLNRWSFAQHLWHIYKDAIDVARSDTAKPLGQLIDHGKEHIGKVAEGMALFEKGVENAV
ncbi:MAG: hypothetical protein JXA89_05245 [Anaerolineae bacterium]|nr:hypothetical protein [Anaerolineae bacterium]